MPQLSGGMQQRLAIARTLASDPRILLMDEPFGALDTQTRELLQLQLLETRSSAMKTILFVTHDIEEAIFLADRILILTARPAKLKAEFRVDLPSPRDLDVKMSSPFVEIKRDIVVQAREEAMKAEAGSASPVRARAAFREEHRFSSRRHKKD